MEFLVVPIRFRILFGRLDAAVRSVYNSNHTRKSCFLLEFPGNAVEFLGRWKLDETVLMFKESVTNSGHRVQDGRIPAVVLHCNQPQRSLVSQVLKRNIPVDIVQMLIYINTNIVLAFNLHHFVNSHWDVSTVESHLRSEIDGL